MGERQDNDVVKMARSHALLLLRDSHDGLLAALSKE